MSIVARPQRPAGVAPVQRVESLREQVYSSLRELLSRGRLGPGARLTETALADALGVSRTPVREALARLRQEGLISVSPRGTELVVPSRRDIDEIFEVRLLLEPHAARRAAARGDADRVEALAGLRRALQQERATVASRDATRFAQANRAFRGALLAMAGNLRLAEATQRLDDLIQALRFATLDDRGNRQTVLRLHAELVESIERGDAAGAERATREVLLAARAAALAHAGAEAAP